MNLCKQTRTTAHTKEALWMTLATLVGLLHRTSETHLTRRRVLPSGETRLLQRPTTMQNNILLAETSVERAYKHV